MKGSSADVLALLLRLSIILFTILKKVALSEEHKETHQLGLRLQHCRDTARCISGAAYSLQNSFPSHSRPLEHSRPVVAPFLPSTCRKRGEGREGRGREGEGRDCQQVHSSQVG